jgi:hypothetical protein
VHWATIQKGKLKGNCGCAIYGIDELERGVELELLFMWSIPFVGEDVAQVYIGFGRIVALYYRSSTSYQIR